MLEGLCMLKRYTMKINIFLILFTFIISGCMLSIDTHGEENNVLSPEEVLQDIYNKRNESFLTGDTSTLKEFYDTSQKYGIWALEHEIKRVKYFCKWTQEREMELVDVKTYTRIKKKTVKGNKAYLALEETYKFDYIYPQDTPTIINTFGVGIRHWVNLVKKNDKWIVYNDWYTDCFEDALRGITANIDDNTDRDSESHIVDSYFIELIEKSALAYGGRYNRVRAVQYADKYCGAAWGSGNNYKYNPIYYDLNGAGGDCTNFVSQVLGDKKEGGGIPFDCRWYCNYPKHGRAQGGTAWANADGLKNYLINSGRGSVIKRGTFKELSPSTKDYRLGPVGYLHPGDLVCYEKKGDIDHFAVVTARDSRGYALINSHTTDRYHVPWDLGWGDAGIKFYLIHIAY
jgi:hypothetical protein